MSKKCEEVNKNECVDLFTIFLIIIALISFSVLVLSLSFTNFVQLLFLFLFLGYFMSNDNVCNTEKKDEWHCNNENVKTDEQIDAYYMMMFGKTDYKDIIGTLSSENKIKNALEKAHDIRKFEIDLLWKRASYYWVFIAFAFVAYGLTINFSIQHYDKISYAIVNIQEIGSDTPGDTPSDKQSSASDNSTEKNANATNTEDSKNSIKNIGKNENVNDFIYGLLTFINLLGTLLSVLWVEVVRSSKTWYENWEKHIDMLEFHITGNLQKCVYTSGLFQTASISKLTIASSIVVFLVWVAMQLATAFFFSEKPFTDNILGTYFLLFLLFWISVRHLSSSRANHTIATTKNPINWFIGVLIILSILVLYN